MKTKLLMHYLERKNERQMRQKKHDDTQGFIHKGLLSRANTCASQYAIAVIRVIVRDSGDTCYVYKISMLLYKIKRYQGFGNKQRKLNYDLL